MKTKTIASLCNNEVTNHCFPDVLFNFIIILILFVLLEVSEFPLSYKSYGPPTEV